MINYNIFGGFLQHILPDGEIHKGGDDCHHHQYHRHDTKSEAFS